MEKSNGSQPFLKQAEMKAREVRKTPRTGTTTFLSYDLPFQFSLLRFSLNVLSVPAYAIMSIS